LPSSLVCFLKFELLIISRLPFVVFSPNGYFVFVVIIMYYCYKYFAPRGPLATFGAAGPGCLLEFGAGGGGAPRLIISRSLGAAASGSSPRSDFSFVLLSSAVFRSSEAIHGLFMSIHPPRSGSIVQVWGPKTMDVNRCRPRDSSPKCVGGALATSAREKPSRKAGRLVGPIEQSRPIIQTRLGGEMGPEQRVTVSAAVLSLSTNSRVPQAYHQVGVPRGGGGKEADGRGARDQSCRLR
jgi:hypothetical protein